jgi:hypothetical protein
MLSHVVPVNEEVNVIERVPKEGHPPVEVGFDIYGTDPEPDYPVDQGKPRMHSTLLVFYKVYITYAYALLH